MLSAPKLVPGDRVAILSPAFAAPAVAPELHEQALRRLTELTGLIPVEFPTTRQLGASPQERAADVNAAFADPSIRAIIATIGGDDQVLVVPHLDQDAVVCVGVPFGHTRPQWIVPYGGELVLDGAQRTVGANY